MFLESICRQEICRRQKRYGNVGRARHFPADFQAKQKAPGRPTPLCGVGHPGGLYAYARDKKKKREARLLSLLCKCAPALRRRSRRRAGALLCTSYALCALRMNSDYTCAANRRLLFGAKKVSYAFACLSFPATREGCAGGRPTRAKTRPCPSRPTEACR